MDTPKKTRGNVTIAMPSKAVSSKSIGWDIPVIRWDSGEGDFLEV